MRRIRVITICLLFLIGIGVWAVLGSQAGYAIVKELPSNQWDQELKAIDQALEVLTELRNKELAKAAQAQNQGDRLQFQFPNLIDARRAWEQADKSRAIAARYQQEITKLHARKAKILRQHESQSPIAE